MTIKQLMNLGTEIGCPLKKGTREEVIAQLAAYIHMNEVCIKITGDNKEVLWNYWKQKLGSLHPRR